MDNRCKAARIVADVGICLLQSNEEGEVIIRAVMDDSKAELSGEEMYEAQVKPELLPGYDWCEDANGLWVSQRKSDGSLIKFIPTNCLGKTGYRDGKYGHRIGLRNWDNVANFEKYYSDPKTPEFYQTVKMIEAIGGFWITCCPLSKDEGDQEIHSLIGDWPCINISFEEAKNMAANFEKHPDLESHLPYGSEYDAMLEWIIRASNLAYIEVVKDSKRWGNFNDVYKTASLLKNGSDSKFNILGLCDVAGNVSEFTQELKMSKKAIRMFEENPEMAQKMGLSIMTEKAYARGGGYSSVSYEEPAAKRVPVSAKNGHQDISARAVILPKFH